jgi:hypothetical protein
VLSRGRYKSSRSLFTVLQFSNLTVPKLLRSACRCGSRPGLAGAVVVSLQSVPKLRSVHRPEMQKEEDTTRGIQREDGTKAEEFPWSEALGSNDKRGQTDWKIGSVF